MRLVPRFPRRSNSLRKKEKRRGDHTTAVSVDLLHRIFLLAGEEAVAVNAPGRILCLALVSKAASEWVLPLLPRISFHTEVKQWKTGVLPEFKPFLDIHVQPQYLLQWCQWHVRRANDEKTTRHPNSIMARSAIHTVILSGGPPISLKAWVQAPKEHEPFRILAPTLRRFAVDLGVDKTLPDGSILWYATRVIRPVEVSWRSLPPSKASEMDLFTKTTGTKPRLPRTTHLFINLGAAITLAYGSPEFHIPKLRYVILEDGDEEPEFVKLVIRKLSSLRSLRRIVLGHSTSNATYVSAAHDPAKVMLIEMDRERAKEPLRPDHFEWLKKLWKHIEETDNLQRMSGDDPHLKKVLAMAW